MELHGAAEHIERSGTHITAVFNFLIMPSPRPTVIGPSALLHNRRPVRINVIIHAIWLIWH